MQTLLTTVTRGEQCRYAFKLFTLASRITSKCPWGQVSKSSISELFPARLKIIETLDRLNREIHITIQRRFFSMYGKWYK